VVYIVVYSEYITASFIIVYWNIISTYIGKILTDVKYRVKSHWPKSICEPFTVLTNYVNPYREDKIEVLSIALYSLC